VSTSAVIAASARHPRHAPDIPVSPASPALLDVGQRDACGDSEQAWPHLVDLQSADFNLPVDQHHGHPQYPGELGHADKGKLAVLECASNSGPVALRVLTRARDGALTFTPDSWHTFLGMIKAGQL